MSASKKIETEEIKNNEDTTKEEEHDRHIEHGDGNYQYFFFE